MTTSLDTILNALSNNSKKTVRHNGYWMAQCPAHPDRRPSLAISHKDERTLLHCFAGCDTRHIIDTLNLNITDLFDNPLTINETDLAKYLLANTPTFTPTPVETPVETPAETPADQPTTTTEYHYPNADGTPAYKTIKTQTPDGKKTFRQQRYENGQWINGLNGQTPPLYRLPELLDAINNNKHIIICEGEKDADTFNNLNEPNMFATTNPMGAGKWRQQHTDTLKDAIGIYIIHDNDEPGINHAITIAEQLTTIGKPPRILTPREGKDLTDHINAGYTLEDLIDNAQNIEEQKQARAQERLTKLIDEEIEKQTARDAARRHIANINASNRYNLPDHATTLTEELNKPDEPIRYIIDQLWPNGANISLTATYKAGKTSTINNIIKALTDNQPLFGHYTTNHTGRIAYWNYEVAANQIRIWLREVNIKNSDNITLLNMRGHTWPITTQYVTDQTITWLADHNITTWIIDPLARAFVGSGDENSNAEVGIFLDTLDYIKEQSGVSNLLIAAHTGRNNEQGNNRARGASRFDDWVDARWIITKDNEGQRWFSADGRDVDQPESRLDWNTETRQQTIALGLGRKENKLEETATRVYNIIANAGATGITRSAIINAYKTVYKEESLSNESADTGTLRQLQDRGLVYYDKHGTSKIFKATNNQLRMD